nr:hypothetical protein [Micromonospora sp. DSM 115978]
MRLDQFDGQLGTTFDKQVAASSMVREVPIRGFETTALWVDGPHPVSYVGRDGVAREASARLSASTLIWQVDDVTYRLEGAFGFDEAVAVAASVR